MDESIRLLYVENDAVERRDRGEALAERSGLQVRTAASAREGLDRLDEDIDCVLSDLEMPGMDGIEFLEEVRAQRCGFPFLLFSARQSEDAISRALAAGVSDYVFKHTCTESYDLLVNRIETVVDHYRARQRLGERGQPDTSGPSSDRG